MTLRARVARILEEHGVVCFRVYPSPKRRGLYVQVRVFRNASDMRHVARAEGSRGMARVEGLMQSYKRIRVHTKKPDRVLPVFGCVNLHRKRLGISVVSHEFAHAAFAWAARMRIWGELTQGDTMRVEERYCHALGEMLRQFMVKAERAGLYP